MWELHQRVPHGRLSLRNFSLLVTVVLVTFLGISSLFTQTAHADAIVTRDGSNVTYQSDSYTPVDKSQLPSDILQQAPTTTGYRYIDTNNPKAYFIFTTGDASKATSGYYVTYDFVPPGNYSNPSPRVNVTISATAPAASTDNTKEVSACDGETMGGIGFIVCPTVNFIAKGMDKIYSIISGFLEVKTVTGNTNSSIYQLWSVVRDVANVAFVIAFLVIVYSQITSVGISNYGIKSMLPRLMVAALLVNVSFWICAAAVDASNILGYSIHSLFVGLMDKYSVGGNYTGSMPTWGQIAGYALSGGAATGIVLGGGLFIAASTVGGAIYLLIPFLLGAIVAALVALIVLATRQALITVLIIIAPLAFVAYILPNTEKYFKQWREGLTTLLVLFPIFSAVFSGAQLAGMAIVQSAGGNIFTIMLGMAVQVAPLAITPMLVKFSGSIMGKVAGMANNSGKKLTDKSREWSKGKALEHKNKVLADQNRFIKRNPLNRATKAIDTRRRHKEGRRKTYEAMAENRFADTKKGHKLEAMNRGTANQKKRIENRFADSRQGRQLELESLGIGVDKQEIENSMMRSDEGHRITHRQRTAEVDKTRVGTEFEETQLGHQVDRAKRVAESEKKRIDNTHQADWDNATRTDAGLYALNLGVKDSESKAATAKGKLEKVDAEVVSQGANSEHILSLRGANARAQAGMLKIAHDLQEENVIQSAATTGKGMAERATAEYRTKVLTENTMVIDGKTIVEYSGGVKGESGRNAVIAKAKAEGSAVLMEDIKNIRSTMPYPLSTDNDELYDEFKKTDDLAKKVAYAQAMGKNGGPGIGKLRSLLEELGSDGGTILAQDQLSNFKEILASESSIMSAGKDIEFYLTNSSHKDKEGKVILKTDGTPKYKTFHELSHDLSTWKNLSPAAFAGQNASTQFFALEQLHDEDHEAYMRIIDGIRTNPGALGQVKQGVVEKFSIYSDSVIDAMKKQGQTPVAGEKK